MLTRVNTLRSTLCQIQFVIAVALLSLVQTVSVAEAQTTSSSTWIGGAGGNWFDAENWSTGVVPDDPSFSPSTNVVIDSDPDVDATVRLSEDGRTLIRSLDVDAGDLLLLRNESFDTPQLAIQGTDNTTNVLSNQGLISLQTTADGFLDEVTTLELVDNSTLSGGGTIDLSVASLQFNRGSVFDPEATNVDNLIQGFGEITFTDFVRFTNAAAGVISANQNGSQLGIRDADFDVDFINEGTLIATNGGQLNLGVGITNTGVIEAQDNSTIVIEGGSIISGGTIGASGSGAVEVSLPFDSFDFDAATLRDVTLNSNINLQRGASLNLQGSIENRQSITTVVPNNFGFGAQNLITISGETTLTGGGTVDLEEASFGFAVQSVGQTTPSSLVNVDNTIQGTGSISANLVNEADGLVTANINSGTLEIVTDDAISGDQTVINRGTLRAENGGVLSLLNSQSDANVINEGVIEALDNSVVAVNDVTGGVLRSEGTGRVDVFGEISDLTLEGTIGINGAEASGVIINEGSIEIGTDFQPNSVLAIREDTVFAGGGRVVLSSPSSNFTESGIVDALNSDFSEPVAGPAVLTNFDNTIIGDGFIGSETLTVINEADGIIEASGVLRLVPPSFLPNDEFLVNRGILRAGVDSTLILNGGQDVFTLNLSEIDNENGLIEALAGGQVDLTGANAIGGTLSTVDSGAFIVRGNSFNEDLARISEATVNGNIQFTEDFGQLELDNITTNGQDLNFTVTNDNFAINGIGQNAINFIGDTNLNEGGTIRLAGDGIAITDVSTTANVGNVSNTNNTIEGFGQIDFQSENFVNEADGLIDANVDQRSLVIFNGTGSNGVANEGVLRASDGGDLAISGRPDSNLSRGILDNTGGRIEAVSGSTISLINQAIVIGGEIVGDADSRLVLGTGPFASPFPQERGLLADVTLDIAAEIEEGFFFGIDGDIVNRQSILVQNNSTLFFNNDTTLSGGGTIQIGAPDGSDFRSAIDGNSGQFATLTNVDNTIQGSGEVGSFNSNLSIVNEESGVIQANIENETLTVTSVADPLINRGTLRAGSNATLELFNFTSSATDFDLDNDGIIESQEFGLITGSGSFRNGVDGTLQGDGTIQFESILNEGTIAPGLSLGTLTLNGEVSLASSSLLEIELSGTEDGQFDVLDVFGGVGLGGLLSVNLDGFTPTADDEFRVAIASEFFGSFDNVAFGDLLRSDDGSFDFLVSLDDTGIAPALLLSNFQAVGVPEPSSATLIGLALVTGIIRRRRSC